MALAILSEPRDDRRSFYVDTFNYIVMAPSRGKPNKQKEGWELFPTGCTNKEKIVKEKMMIDFIAAVVPALRCDEMDVAIMKNWILNPNDLADVLREALMPSTNKKQPDQSVVHSSATLAAKYGFTVEKDQDVLPTQLNISDLNLQTFLKEGENCITGEEMRRRAHTKNGNFGLVDGERWKNEMNNSKDKFKKWQGKCIVLPGTLLRDSDGHHLYVAYLCWYGASWELSFDWLGFGWVDDGRFASRE